MERWDDTYVVTIDGTDLNGRATMPWICRQLQETATHHAEHLGVGYGASQARGNIWVLSRMWVRMNRYPGLGDDVGIATWPSGQSKMTWDRDFRLTDADGEEFGVATTLWLYIDHATRRPRPSREGLTLNVDGVERVRSENLKGLPTPEVMRSAEPLRVGFYSIDVHGHVNNVSYITWILESLSHEWLTDRTLTELEINFLAEGFAGEALVPQLAEAVGGIVDHALVHRDSQKVICRARTTWRE